MQQSKLVFNLTKVKFLLEPSIMSIWSWGFCFQWLRLLKIYFALTKGAEDKHGCKCSLENGWKTAISLQCPVQ